MNRCCRRALRREYEAHTRALSDLREQQQLVSRPAGATARELAARQAAEAAVRGGGEAVARLQATQRNLAQALLPCLTAKVEVTAAQLLAAADTYKPAAPLPKPELTQPGDHLTALRAAAKREHATTTHLCARRAAQVGTVAQQAPPVVVSNNEQQHRLVLITPGVSPPM